MTGGGAASVKLPARLAANTALGNLKTSLAGTCHAFGFRKYAHRYLAQAQIANPTAGRSIVPASSWSTLPRPPASKRG